MIIVIMILKDKQLFKYYLYFLYSMLGTSLLWRSTVAFTYLKVKSDGCLRWSWYWARSCYFGLGLTNLVLFTSLQSRYINLWYTLPCRQRSPTISLYSYDYTAFQQLAQLMLTNPCDAFRGQSRSPNIHSVHYVRYSYLLV